MNQTKKRNIIGSILCAIICLITGGVGLAVFMLREAYQSKKYGFSVERDDIIRYSIIGGVASAIQLATIILILT